MTVLVGESGERYLLGAPLAVGGQGAVHLARAEADDREVVIKVALAPGEAGEAVRAAGSRLVALAEDPIAGPHLVPVWDVGRWNGRWFLVCERMPHTLEVLHDRDDGARLRGLNAAIAAASALQRAGVVHGDLKPSNLFLRDDDDQWVVLAGDLWAPGSLAPVSVGFSAPEVLRGAPPGLAADRYSLAATIWALCAGVPPPCALAAVTDDVPLAPPTRVELAASGIPGAWRPVIGQLLSPDPRLRPPLERLHDPSTPRGWANEAAAALCALAVAGGVMVRSAGPDPCPAPFERLGGTCTALDGRVIVRVPAGRFVAGTDDPAQVSLAPDAPLRPVVLTRPVWFRDAEVTQAEYERLLGANPVLHGIELLADLTPSPCHTWAGQRNAHPERPVACVSWWDAVAAANAASTADGLPPAYEMGTAPDGGPTIRWRPGAAGWRLPTEAEWEWAARGLAAAEAWAGAPARDAICGWGNPRDQSAPEFWGNEVACADGVPVLAPVRSFAPNALRLYDLIGNVSEWTWDWYGPAPSGTDPTGPASGSARVLRGGGWNQVARPVTARFAAHPDSIGLNAGLRLVRDAGAPVRGRPNR